MDATWIMLPVVAALALAVGFLIHKTSSDRRIGGAEREARRIVESAERDAETRRKSTELEAREATLKARSAFEDARCDRLDRVHALDGEVGVGDVDAEGVLDEDGDVRERVGVDQAAGDERLVVAKRVRRVADDLAQEILAQRPLHAGRFERGHYSAPRR